VVLKSTLRHTPSGVVCDLLCTRVIADNKLSGFQKCVFQTMSCWFLLKWPQIIWVALSFSRRIHAAISKRTSRTVFSWPGVNHSTQPVWMESALGVAQAAVFQVLMLMVAMVAAVAAAVPFLSRKRTLNLFVLNFLWRFYCILKCPRNFLFDLNFESQINQLKLYGWEGGNSISPDKEKVAVVERHSALAQLRCDAVVRRVLVS